MISKLSYSLVRLVRPNTKELNSGLFDKLYGFMAPWLQNPPKKLALLQLLLCLQLQLAPWFSLCEWSDLSLWFTWICSLNMKTMNHVLLKLLRVSIGSQFGSLFQWSEVTKWIGCSFSDIKDLPEGPPNWVQTGVPKQWHTRPYTAA